MAGGDAMNEHDEYQVDGALYSNERLELFVYLNLPIAYLAACLLVGLFA